MCSFPYKQLEIRYAKNRNLKRVSYSLRAGKDVDPGNVLDDVTPPGAAVHLVDHANLDATLVVVVLPRDGYPEKVV